MGVPLEHVGCRRDRRDERGAWAISFLLLLPLHSVEVHQHEDLPGGGGPQLALLPVQVDQAALNFACVMFPATVGMMPKNAFAACGVASPL